MGGTVGIVRRRCLPWSYPDLLERHDNPPEYLSSFEPNRATVASLAAMRRSKESVGILFTTQKYKVAADHHIVSNFTGSIAKCPTTEWQLTKVGCNSSFLPHQRPLPLSCFTSTPQLTTIPQPVGGVSVRRGVVSNPEVSMFPSLSVSLTGNGC